MRVHLDTDLGGDPDDACALVMLLGWADVDLVGITTNLDVEGRRAGCVAHYLHLLARDGIPIAAGAGASMTTLATHEPTWGDARHWPDSVDARPGPIGDALDLLSSNIEAGATIITIGALTNLALLEVAWPGLLAEARIVVMGGWVDPLGDGYPEWTAERDWNVQCDTRAAEIVFTRSNPTIVSLAAAIGCQLRERDLPRLRAAGRAGELLARQSETHGIDHGNPVHRLEYEGLADDLVNFHWDPVTCAVAVGWDGASTVERRLVPAYDGDALFLRDDLAGRAMQVVTDVDSEAFAETWISAVERACRVSST